MIAANNCPSDDEPNGNDGSGSGDGAGDSSLVPPSSSNGGYMGGAQIPSLMDKRIRSNANRLAKLVEAGEIAADKLPWIVERAVKLMSDKKCNARSFAALGKLIETIAKAGDGDKHNHLHVHGPQQIEVIHVDDWYGSKAANSAATDAASSRRVNGS